MNLERTLRVRIGMLSIGVLIGVLAWAANSGLDVLLAVDTVFHFNVAFSAKVKKKDRHDSGKYDCQALRVRSPTSGHAHRPDRLVSWIK